MKRAMLVAAACALPLAALAQDMPVPRLLKGMEKGSWRTEVLEHSEAKGQSEQKCKQRLIKDAADEAVLEISCPENTVVTTMKRESAKSMLADVKTTGKNPMTMKVRYTYQGACREGQAAMGMDKDSEQCKKIRESVAKMDPAKSCAGSGQNREQCESMIRQQIAQAKAMCN